MGLQGQTVRIMVSEPRGWDENLFGKILSDRGGKRLLVELTKPIKWNRLKSDLIALRPIYEKDTFKPLQQYYAVNVQGTLIGKDGEEIVLLLVAQVTLD
ncbi:hypothetical protein [Sphingobacterium bambusae]|uniref:Uncharacterized protein n=1 Tax=Sphingobacterium bambusae TaxID=662858 RepID=A0ABW6BL01_9SPHI|nr:hypothetical protein [Sphingobacterium bambusae]WPL50984.1 hypothetical protein SCB77_11040 [Sphingobacterium bambusae]